MLRYFRRSDVIDIFLKFVCIKIFLMITPLELYLMYVLTNFPISLAVAIDSL